MQHSLWDRRNNQISFNVYFHVQTSLNSSLCSFTLFTFSIAFGHFELKEIEIACPACQLKTFTLTRRHSKVASTLGTQRETSGEILWNILPKTVMCTITIHLYQIDLCCSSWTHPLVLGNVLSAGSLFDLQCGCQNTNKYCLLHQQSCVVSEGLRSKCTLRRKLY